METPAHSFCPPNIVTAESHHTEGERFCLADLRSQENLELMLIKMLDDICKRVNASINLANESNITVKSLDMKWINKFDLDDNPDENIGGVTIKLQGEQRV